MTSITCVLFKQDSPAVPQRYCCYTYALLLFQDKDEQTRLEMKHRKEEDDLYRKFARQREEEDKRMKEEFRVSMNVIFFYFNKKKTLCIV